MNLITLENITKSYSEKILVDNISLGINEITRKKAREKDNIFFIKLFFMYVSPLIENDDFMLIILYLK